MSDTCVGPAAPPGVAFYRWPLEDVVGQKLHAAEAAAAAVVAPDQHAVQLREDEKPALRAGDVRAASTRVPSLGGGDRVGGSPESNAASDRPENSVGGEGGAIGR